MDQLWKGFHTCSPAPQTPRHGTSAPPAGRPADVWRFLWCYFAWRAATQRKHSTLFLLGIREQRNSYQRPSITPIGKPPPLAVRLPEALPFRRAPGSEEKRPLNVRPPTYSRGLPAPDPYCAGLWRGDIARVTPCASANGSRGFGRAFRPFPRVVGPLWGPSSNYPLCG